MKTEDKWPSKEGLRIGFLNINSIINKIDQLSAILFNSGQQFHVFCCAETRLSENIKDADVSIPGYKSVRLDPVLPKQTGLILYISHSINYKRLFSYEIYNVESMWIEIYLKRSKSLYVGFIYRNPDELIDWIDDFIDMTEAVSLTDNEIIMFGDFNMNLLKTNQRWTQTFQNLNLNQIINQPTRVTSSSSTLIDHIYVNNPNHIIEICCPNSGCSDHFPVCITWLKKGTRIPKSGHKFITYRSFAKFDKDSFLLDLANSDISNVYQLSDANDAFCFWQKTFIDIYNKHAPFITRRIKHTPKPPWFTKDIDKAIQIRDTLLKTKKFELFKKQRNLVTSMIRSAKKKYFRDIVSNGHNNSKSIWKAINILTKRNIDKMSTSIQDISVNDLNSHFANISRSTIKTDNSHLNDLQFLKDFCQKKNIVTDTFIPPITIFDVYYHLTHLKQTNTRGLDNIDGKILKLCAPIISDSLTYLYNLCIDQSNFPVSLKQAKIIPLFKSGDKTNPSNYRPISVLPIVAKPLEKHIYKNLMLHILNNNLLHPNQSGFRKNHSCHTALTNLVEEWLLNINNNKFTGVLFIDFAKAFDLIDHELLLKKLAVYRFSDHAISLVKSFLSDRQHKVHLNNDQSQFLTQTYGVPQGSVLGPLLFSLYINDLPLFIHNGLCELFADDTSIHSCNSDLKQLHTSLQDNISQLISWAELNHMSLNNQKTKYMIITSRQKRQNITSPIPPIFVDNVAINEVTTHKVLGVTIDNNLSWSPHINYLCKLVSQRLFQLSKIKNFLDIHARKQYYHAYISSSINYGSTLFDLCSEHVLKPLARIHKRSLKVVLSKSASLAYADYLSLNVLPISLKLQYNKAVLMYKIMNDYAPCYLTSRFPKNQSRYTDKILIKKPRLDLFKTSLAYSGGTLWNSMPCDIKNKKSICSFKSAYKSFLFIKLRSVT